MPRLLNQILRARVQSDPAFRDALLAEGVDALLTGDIDTGKAILRDYINATVGFDKLAEETGTPPKSLMRMFGPRGNPRARNLFLVINQLQRSAGVSLTIRSTR